MSAPFLLRRRRVRACLIRRAGRPSGASLRPARGWWAGADAHSALWDAPTRPACR